MQNVSQPKVFEFAKEIGMETLALMDKIREWKLPVRSHMAELDAEMLNQIRERLQAEKTEKPAESAKKKKVAKKAAAAPAEGEAPPAKKAATKAAAPKAAAPKATRATAAKKAAPATEETPAPAAAGAKKQVVRKAAVKTVVRRAPTEEEKKAQEAEAAAAAQAEAEAAAAHAAPETTVEAAPEPEVMAAAPVAQEAAPAAEEAPQAQTPAAPQASPATTAAAAAGPARKREVSMTSGGPSSGIKSEAPRRNIVGRMDLSRVAPPPGAGGDRPQRSGPVIGRPGQGGPSAGPAQRNLRTGFVSAAPPPAFPDGDDDRRGKFEDKKKKFGTAAPGGPGAASTGKEEVVQTFSATEFRKREMVFQPKKKKGMLARESRKTEITTPKASKRVVKVDQTMKVGDLAQEMGIKAGQIVKVLMTNGVMATMTTDLDFDTIALIVPEFGFEAVNVHKTVEAMIDEHAFGNLDAESILRPPVVTIMGHVDHGKTSLLDSIRNAKVAAGEAGGITQHIGAYQVKTDTGHLITFLDTPGHEAFTNMRARGANATDIAVIVIAADDGVMPQTAEAINHAKAAGVPIIVALNKIDKAGANPDKIKRELTEFELVPEEWGGSTIFVETSAIQKTGINELLEQIHLVAEMEELKANPDRSATGLVIEARVDKGRGAVATLLVQDGTLKVGQSIVVGKVAGRVRSLMDYKGERVQEAGPAMPVEVLGLSEAPMAGDRFDVAKDDQAAAAIAATRKEQAQKAAQDNKKMSLEDIFAKMKQGDIKELPIVLKTDVAGSAEAIRGMFDKVGTDEVKIKVIHTAVGGINESDVLLASTANGIIVGFNVRPDGSASAAAKREGVEIKTYTIVYELMDDMKKAMAGLLAPTVVEKELGRAEVRNIFSVPKMGVIAGSFVADGKITRQAQVRLVRDGKIIYTGKIGSLKRFKDDAREVASGFECGIGIENFNDIKVGDVIEAFQTESIVREL